MAAVRQVLAALAVDLFEDSSESDSENERVSREPFNIRQISERMLFQHTKLNRHVFCYVLEVISPALTKNTRKGRYQHLTPMQKLYVTLQFYATASYHAEDYPAVKRAFYKLELTRHGRGFPNVPGLRALTYDISIRNYFCTRVVIQFCTHLH
ncbi:hypothetical protein BDFB_014313 [Asbolus verrucosus]|uniref:Uncharacterized protein n=1 Tax=Asbolus verrucosus TaxID=1661398 RepID=A0A482W7I4_ASBVE|nr:hypothetical protein BDFB_014313 [Asbolus verrucosus]